MARAYIEQIDSNSATSIQATAEAYYELGVLYASGRQGAPNLIEAHKWFNIAVARGYGDAVIRRAELAAEMTRDEIASAQRAARDWLTRH